MNDHSFMFMKLKFLVAQTTLTDQACSHIQVHPTMMFRLHISPGSQKCSQTGDGNTNLEIRTKLVASCLAESRHWETQ